MKKRLLIVIAFIGFFTSLQSQPLSVSEDGHYLLDRRGEPFFWLGDTAWELFHRLDREEVVRYLDNRKAKGFNVIQAVALYELQSDTPNAYGDFPAQSPVGKNGLLLTKGKKPADKEAYDYWDHVEFVVEEAAKREMLVGLLPCWGEYVTPRKREREISSPAEGEQFGKAIGNRLAHLNDHIIWIMGGDRLPDEAVDGVDTWRSIAKGITHAIAGKDVPFQASFYDKTFMTYHCYATSSRWFHEDAWIDMHTWGSYHEKKDNDRPFRMPMYDWRLDNPKPSLNSEPAYEILPVNYDWAEARSGYFDDFDVRQIAYWSLLAGSCGHTYGCHPVWQMYKKANPNPPLTTTVTKEWEVGLDEPGAFQMGHLKWLFTSRPFASLRPAPELLAANLHDPTGHLEASLGDGFAFIYNPTGKMVTVRLKALGFKEWNFWIYNPRTGEKGKSLEVQIENELAVFEFPGEPSRGNDWVLVIDDKSKPWEAPKE